MSTVKVAILLEQSILKELDQKVRKNIFPNRSKAIQKAVEEKISRMNRIRLAKECAKLDNKFEQYILNPILQNKKVG